VELLPLTLRQNIPRLGTTSEETDPMLWARLFNPVSGWSWYLIELEPLEQDAILYVYEVGWDAQLTYYNASDLDLHAAQVGTANQIDTTFRTCRLSEVKAREEGVSAKFPLGQVVATPGALAAFEAAGQSPLDFLKRHVLGDWGDLDEHDRAENEFSLTHGLRLLSAYSLRDGTKIWIITEHDRSSSTILLPSEY
jgi:hypothetical protein